MIEVMRYTMWLATLVLLLVRRPSELATLSYYGTEEDGFLGQHHSAYWQGHSYFDMPDVVDDENLGTAAPYWVPLGSHLMVCYDGKCVVVVVVDRQRDDVLFGKPHLDLWSAAAETLGMVDVGIVEGRVWGMPVVPSGP